VKAGVGIGVLAGRLEGWKAGVGIGVVGDWSGRSKYGRWDGMT